MIVVPVVDGLLSLHARFQVVILGWDRIIRPGLGLYRRSPGVRVRIRKICAV